MSYDHIWQLGLIFEEEDDIKNAFFHFKKSVQLEEKYNFPNLIEHDACFEKFRYGHDLRPNGCVDWHYPALLIGLIGFI